jgi:hypothetical protein
VICSFLFVLFVRLFILQKGFGSPLGNKIWKNYQKSTIFGRFSYLHRKFTKFARLLPILYSLATINTYFYVIIRFEAKPNPKTNSNPKTD